MTSTSLLSMALALLCVLSIGVSATTLESSMQTDPDDVIDLDWDRVPIGEDTAAEVNQEMRANGESEGSGGSGEEEAERRSQPDEAERRSLQAAGGERPGTGQPGAGGQDADGGSGLSDAESQDAAGGSGGEDRAGSNAQQEAGTGVPNESPWDPWWVLAAIALVAALLAVGYRYAGRLDTRASPTDAADPPPWPPDGTMTDVDRAWFAMVRRLDVERPWTRTPGEFASAAVDAGMDPAGVEAVTDAFAEVRYGGSPVTDDRRERARSALRRLGLEPEGEPA